VNHLSNSTCIASKRNINMDIVSSYVLDDDVSGHDIYSSTVVFTIAAVTMYGSQFEEGRLSSKYP